MNVPSDWPAPGPLDLQIQDLPHRSATTEWWYVNSHFQTPQGRQLSLFAAFFRIVAGKDPQTHAPVHAHAVTWAITDASGKVYHSESRIDRNSPRLGLEKIRSGHGASRDQRINRAMTEILERGSVPAPDRRFEGDVTVSERRLELDYAGARFTKRDDGSYRLILANAREHVGCELDFHPEKPPVRHGDNGVVRGQSGESMFYYFIPRCRVSGTVTLSGCASPVTGGSGWYDHEFGGDVAAQAAPAGAAGGAVAAPVDIAWNWASVQLSNGHEVTAYALTDRADNKLLYQWAVVVGAQGVSLATHDFRFEPGETWRSMRTFHDYPVTWRLVVPEAGLDLALTASFPDQEFITVLSSPAFWEGRCEVSGRAGDAPVTGLAYVERSGFETIRDLDDFFGAVGEVVRGSVERALPLAPTFAQARDLVASAEREHYMDGVDLAQLSRALLKPIREITDRGGKSWRSYAALACCDVVGGDSRRFAEWLAMPELLHVGSLIVDDVQDRSAVRRGGPACHLIYGEPLAVNAGTAAYFLTQRLLIANDVSSERKLRLYDLYFEAMRAGHAGQAIDLDGMGELVRTVAQSGDAALLERRVLATHRLKTAAPAGALARMGAVVGGGSEAQIEAVGRFFEALGLAFQLIDDVLNVRGFKGELKSPGEDVANGTVTLPVAKAMARLDLAQRRWLCETLESKPKDDRRLIADVSATLERCGALEACVSDARELVENAWERAAPLLDDSMPKVMLRAFGWYVLERHY